MIAMNDVEQLRLKSILGQPEQAWTQAEFAGQIGVRHETICNMLNTRKRHN